MSQITLRVAKQSSHRPEDCTKSKQRAKHKGTDKKNSK